MKFLSLKNLVVFIILLVPLEIYEGHLIHIKDKIGEITNNQLIVKGSQEKNDLNLELKNADSRPTNHGEKVETIVIPFPVLNYSDGKYISLFNLQVIDFSKKKYCLISHYNLLILKSLHKSTLVNILRI
jgi:hypothetical protein